MLTRSGTTSFVGVCLQAVSSRLARRLPVEEWPAWLGRIHNIQVPRGVVSKPVRTPRGPANVNILLRLIRTVSHLPGDLAECGVFRGATILPVGLYLRQNEIDKTVFGFDSFEGFDDSVDVDIALGGEQDPTKRVGGFSNTSYDEIRAKVGRLNLAGKITLVGGYFRDTLSKFSDDRFCFVHLDCDIYESYRECLEFFYPRVVDGGIILLDEYNDPPWPGCNKAVDEFLIDKPETLKETDNDNQVKYFIQKECTDTTTIGK